MQKRGKIQNILTITISKHILLTSGNGEFYHTHTHTYIYIYVWQRNRVATDFGIVRFLFIFLGTICIHLLNFRRNQSFDPHPLANHNESI